MPQSQDTLTVRISRIQRTIETFHFRLRNLRPAQTAETLYAKTNLSVLKRSLRALDLERPYGARPREEPVLEPTPQRFIHRRTSDEEMHPSP